MSIKYSNTLIIIIQIHFDCILIIIMLMKNIFMIEIKQNVYLSVFINFLIML